MIVYIASYPRSGNSLIQQLIEAFLQRPITTVYGGSRKPELYAREGHPFIKNWRSTKSGFMPRLFRRIAVGQYLKQHLAYYDLSVAPYTQNIRYLMPGCLRLLKPSIRKYLAQLPDPFFIKTHEPPFATYFAGEKIIFPFRHPGAVIWSYQNYLRDIAKMEYDIVDIIKGNVPHGSWLTYHKKWLQVKEDMPEKFLPLRYKKSLEQPNNSAKELAIFTNIPFKEDGELPAFEKLHRENPNHIRSGKVDAWKSKLKDKERELIGNTLEPTFEKLIEQFSAKLEFTPRQIKD